MTTARPDGFFQDPIDHITAVARALHATYPGDVTPYLDMGGHGVTIDRGEDGFVITAPGDNVDPAFAGKWIVDRYDDEDAYSHGAHGDLTWVHVGSDDPQAIATAVVSALNGAATWCPPAEFH